MAIWLWLAKMDRPLSENEYHDMLELLPEDRRLRLERIPREKHQEVLCAYLLLRLAHEENRCVIVVTHDLTVMDRADVVYRISDGLLQRRQKEQ